MKPSAPPDQRLEQPASVQLPVETWFSLWRGLERAQGQPVEDDNPKQAFEREQRGKALAAIEEALKGVGFDPKVEVVKMRKPTAH